MAGVRAPGQDPDSARPPRLNGLKRAADGQLESEQRLSKRFDLLNLDNGTRLFVPVAAASDAAPTPELRATRSARALPLPAAPGPARPRPPPPDDCMHVDDSPHRVYIADLDAELSDIESDEDNPIFLPDIEKHLAKIPKHLLAGPEPKPTKDNQLILYNVPSSLTVPEAQDSVRKAIEEARGRLRERRAAVVVEPTPAPKIPPLSLDSEAMDID